MADEARGKLVIVGQFPLKHVLLTGEVRCPLKSGIIALEACVAIQENGNARCCALACEHVKHKLYFIDEGKRARGEIVKPRKQPAKRRWLKEGAS